MLFCYRLRISVCIYLVISVYPRWNLYPHHPQRFEIFLYYFNTIPLVSVLACLYPLVSLNPRLTSTSECA